MRWAGHVESMVQRSNPCSLGENLTEKTA